MEFNDVIKKDISPILDKYGFEIIEESKNLILFQSSFVKINMVFNDYENSFLIEIGKIGEMLYPLNNEVVSHVFNLKLPIEKVSLNSFVQNTILLFKSKIGIELLKGNINLLKNIIEKQSKNYTSEIIKEQVLAIALKAWEVKDYISFIENINKIGIDKVPKVYQLRYRIAKKGK